jgi:pilus assembly protein Flp/PilA
MFRVVWNEEQDMRNVISKVRRFVVSEDGPTAVEYAVMLGLIVVAIVGVVSSLAKSVSGTFSTVSSTLGSS